MTKNADSSNHRKTQAERFVETARALGADEDEAAFKDKLRTIAQQKPAEPKPPKLAGKKG